MASPVDPVAPNPAPKQAPSQTSNPAPDQQAGTKELTKLLLQVLRDVNQEVGSPTYQSRIEARKLTGPAQIAFDHFREIARSLRTPADGNETFEPINHTAKAPPG